MNLIRLVASAAAGLASTAPALASDASALAVLDVANKAGGIEIVGKVVALSDVTISGEMALKRSGASGSVTTRQGGEVALKAGETGDIARVGVSFAGGDVLDITLTLRENGAVVAVSTLKTGGP